MAYISFMEFFSTWILCWNQTPNFPPMTKAQGRFPKFFWPMTGRSQNGPHTSQHPMLRGPQVLALFFAQIWLGVAMKTSLKYGGTYNLRRSMLAAIWELLPLLFHLRITKTCSFKFHSICARASTSAAINQHINTPCHTPPLQVFLFAGRWCFLKQCLGESSGQDAKPKCFGASRLFL